MRKPLLAVVVLFAACGADEGHPEPTGVTYYKDIKPLYDAKCAGCHYEGGIAPFALDSFAGASAHGTEEVLETSLGNMPPWPPDPECNEYYADRSITAEQRALIAQWVEDGMLEGDADDPGEPLEVEQVKLSRVDLSLAMEEQYTPLTSEAYPDEYRCFVIPLPAEYTTTKYVTGFRAVPGNPRVVHHVIAFYAAPGELAQYQQLDADEDGDGYTCFGGSGGPSRTMLGGWAPGSQGSDFPPGTGLPIEPGGAVIMQVHYNVQQAGVESDLTRLEMKIDDSVDHVAEIMPWANPGWLQGTSMEIPAGAEDTMHSFSYDATVVTGGQSFTIYSAATHQHQLGTHNKASIARADGTSTCLLEIQNWDFHWQGSYGLRQPIVFDPGDQLNIECHWDNSAGNQPVEGQAPHDVYWGEDTQSEMCVGFFYVTRN